RHAYGGPGNQPIIIQIHIREDRLEIVLRDFGIKADPEKIRSRSLDDVRPGGLGVHLIHSAMDTVEYDTTVEEGNRLILMKQFPKRKKAEDDKR
ncbi:MAG: ATP-binding protein, partial [Calditrichaeota bacterium]